MELASARLHKGQISWWGLLLTASLLTTWSPPTTAQVTIEAVPTDVAEGKDVLLLVHNLPQALRIFNWYKGNNTEGAYEIARFITADNTNRTGAAYSGRETIYQNGSLFFQNVDKSDEGVYTLSGLDQDYAPILKFYVRFYVHLALQKPSITSNNSSPMEGEDSVLMCGPYTDNIIYLWRRNGESLSEGDRLKLSEGNRTLTLLNVTRNDTGPYECEIRNLVSANRSDPFSLNIAYGPDTPSIFPSDTYLLQGSNLSLSCHAASNPPAQYFWLFNEMPQASSQELFIPNVTTNNSGIYTCFVNNSGTGLSRTTVKNITVLEAVTQPFLQVINTTIKELDSVTLTCYSNDTGISGIRWLFNNHSLQLTDRMTLSQNNSILTIDPTKREDAGEYQCEISNPVSSKGSNPIRLDIIGDTTHSLSEGAIAGIVIGCVAGVALIAALAYFLYSRKTGGGSDQRDLTEHKPSAFNHNLGPSDNSPNKVDDVSYTVLNFRDQQPKQPASASPPPRAKESLYSEVKKK
uniref:carcinoembryonic antigen-related cell adhesion molecule 1-like isoform X2 n=1 Tax=Arvicanthis niloticus TaxID=61156 RepID=UPI00148634F3|nr:carcinoembryonic antigen-related cell adhesion molecule 1-like isoform X2 [Arvicanthis niloticus]